MKELIPEQYSLIEALVQAQVILCNRRRLVLLLGVLYGQ